MEDESQTVMGLDLSAIIAWLIRMQATQQTSPIVYAHLIKSLELYFIAVKEGKDIVLIDTSE